MKRKSLFISAMLFSTAMLIGSTAQATEKPNILVIMSDDVGITNLSAYSRGMAGYKTPNIDRIANEGALLTDYYAEQSCTAGRSAFITGQSPVRTGLTKVGFPGSPIGIQKEDPTLAELLKNQGYATGQFGKNHLGDRNQYLPTMHGFDEFYGNLYHLNAEEEPENPDYPKDPEFYKTKGPRGVLDCIATEVDDPTEDPRFGRMGKQKCIDTGALTKKRMETADEEFIDRTIKFIKKSDNAGKPWFAWLNTSRMHFYTHLKKESEGVTGLGIFADGMVEHDGHVGQVLDVLEELGVDENTIILYTADNGPHYNEWPDGGLSPFRGEKNTNWEGGYRVPLLIKWPNHIKPGTVSNEIISSQDWLPTLMAAAGDTGIIEKLEKGHKADGKEFKVHLDGFNVLPHLAGQEEKSPREEFFYFSDDGQLVGVRHNNWKLVFAEQRAKGFRVWSEPFISLRVPKPFNLRTDPFERADTDANNYDRWWIQRSAFSVTAIQELAGEFMGTFNNFLESEACKFNVDDVMKTLYKIRRKLDLSF